jgi:putative two-component system response regulator
MKILIVDDNDTSLRVLTKLSEKLEGAEVLAFSKPDDALLAMPTIDFDIAIVDFQMPVYNGVEFVTEVMRFPKYREKMVVIVTADTDVETRMAALNAGAIDFLTKPVNPLEFRARLRNLAALVEAREKLAERADWLNREVERAVVEIREREEEIIHRLTVAASYKDSETASHTMRVGAYSEAIALAYGLSADAARDIRLAAPMHDVGKVAIPDAILLKKGRLTEQEFAAIQKHTIVGCDILKESKSSLLRLAAEIAASHHERWDGQGYPSRLTRDEIPLTGRIVAIADSFDALTTERPYKEAWPLAVAVDHIRERAGTQFDPASVAAFERALPEIAAIMRRFATSPFDPRIEAENRIAVAPPALAIA